MKPTEQHGKPVERGITTALVTVAMIGLVITFGIAQPGPGWLRGITDCNGNGVDDATDIAAGASIDCNGNGVPDECDIAEGTSDDCNGNGVPDECEADTPFGLVGTYGSVSFGTTDNMEPVDNLEPMDAFEVPLGRIDPQVDFVWGSDPPWPGFSPSDLIEVTWTGYVQTPEDVSGEYAFFLRNDDGARLYVDGQRIINAFRDDQGPIVERMGVITLEGGRAYRLVLDYAESLFGPADATVQLSWQPPGAAKEIIPTEGLLPYRDCNGNGVSDDCDTMDFVYMLDDGGADIYVRSDGTYMAWLNQFTVDGSFDTITAIDISFYSSAVGQPVTLYLWSDSDGDGNPIDASVLIAWSLTVQPGMDNPTALTRIDIPDTFVGSSGASFFVGVIVDVPLGGSDFPAAADWDEPATPGRSWLVGATSPIDPNDLTAGAVEFGLIEDLIPYVVNWTVRGVAAAVDSDCNGNGLPDSCDIAEGRSGDCQPDGVPDECQLGALDTLTYQLDDGAPGSIWGPDIAAELAVLNHFTVTEGGEYISGFDLFPFFGLLDGGEAVAVYLWSDPNQDGDPADAQVLAATFGHTCPLFEACPFELPLTYVGPAGTSFFVGCIVNTQEVTGTVRDVVPLDGSAVGHTWVAIRSDGGLIDPDDLGLDVDYLGRIEDYSSPGNGTAAIRAIGSGPRPGDLNNNGVPDECEILPGDLNCDGVVDFGDINPFVLLLTNPVAWQMAFPDCLALNGDINGDGEVGLRDINPFVVLLSR